MAALSNARHERFAQELAKGKTADEAYQEAGYAANRGNASTLKANQSVMARVAEIQDRAAQRVEISIASATEHLMRLATKAEAIGDPAGIQASRASVMDACKLNGLVVDKSQLDGSLAFTGIARRIVGA